MGRVVLFVLAIMMNDCRLQLAHLTFCENYQQSKPQNVLIYGRILEDC